MKQFTDQPNLLSVNWVWPIQLDSYDRSPALSEVERETLASIARPQGQLNKSGRAALHRLICPLDDLCEWIRLDHDCHRRTVRVVCMEMHRRQTTFWEWSVKEWCESIGTTGKAFITQLGFSPYKTGYYDVRAKLPAIAYLLLPEEDITSLLHITNLPPFGRRIFGKEILQTSLELVVAKLEDWGYGKSKMKKPGAAVASTVCYLLLRNRHPSLSAITDTFMEEVFHTCALLTVKQHLYRVSHALVGLEILKKALPRFKVKPSMSGTDGSLSNEWLSWCQRWRALATAQLGEHNYYYLLTIGHWLQATHSDIVSPAQWTYELCAEFVASVMERKIGEWTDSAATHLTQHRIGHPSRPSTKAHILSALRMFLRNCQEWRWIPVVLDVERALRTPTSLRNQIVASPRVIDKGMWAKILWAAMNLEESDLPFSPTCSQALYPLELVRAIAMVWCFAALRSDEIWRLRVGCIRWQHEDVMVPETGAILPKDAICFLDIPVNKTSKAYTKAVHTLVGQRIQEWERIRPNSQHQLLDQKTGEMVSFLFMHRGRRVAQSYINTSLIPLLCKKAGISEYDARGPITSHRARATIASMLYNAKNPLTIFELKEFLGHKNLSSTQYYLQIDPTKLAHQVVKAGYFEQNMATIEVLLDQEAILNGAAARGEPWKYYDLGHGYCANTFWAECKHRMACARCPFYRPKNSTVNQLIEGKANLAHMLEFVALTDDEKLLVTEGVELHQALIERLADTPTPSGPTPRELNAGSDIIPMNLIKRARGQSL